MRFACLYFNSKLPLQAKLDIYFILLTTSYFRKWLSFKRMGNILDIFSVIKFGKPSSEESQPLITVSCLRFDLSQETFPCKDELTFICFT